MSPSVSAASEVHVPVASAAESDRPPPPPWGSAAAAATDSIQYALGKASDRKALVEKLAYHQALHKNRWAGIWNLGTRALSQVPISGRAHAEAKLTEARKLIDLIQSDEEIPPALVDQINHTLDDGFTNGLRKFDKYIDWVTECGVSNVVSVVATYWTELVSARRELKKQPRLDAKGNYKGLIQKFLMQSIPYYAGLSAARGENFTMEVQKDRTLKFNPAWVFGELGALLPMVGGTALGAMLLEHHAHLKPAKAALFAAIPGGFTGAVWCYWLVKQMKPESENTGVLWAGLRSAVNTSIRFALGPAFRNHAVQAVAIEAAAAA